MSDRPIVLLAEPDPVVARAITTILHRRGYVIEHANSASEAEMRLRESLPDLLVVEFLLPGGSGVRVAELAKALSDDQLPVVVLSALTADVHLAFARAAGADEVLAKPFRASALLAAAGRLCPVAQVEFAEAV